MHGNTKFYPIKVNFYPFYIDFPPNFALVIRKIMYNNKNSLIMIQFISLSTESMSYENQVKVALGNGCRWIQLRMDSATDDQFVEVASHIKHLCDEYRAYFIIEDRVHLVKQVKANGVHLHHLGHEVREARKELGCRYLITVDAESMNEAQKLGADSLGAEKSGYKAYQMVIGCGDHIQSDGLEKRIC